VESSTSQLELSVLGSAGIVVAVAVAVAVAVVVGHGEFCCVKSKQARNQSNQSMNQQWQSDGQFRW
jgi:hypothetical protein